VKRKNNKTGDTSKIKVSGVFSFIGATPRTSWLPAEIDEQGFIKTGRRVRLLRTGRCANAFLTRKQPSGNFRRRRRPQRFGQTSRFAVGEGAMALQFVHEYLKVT
jgi:thioredoxin reductase (NADPH)